MRPIEKWQNDFSETINEWEKLAQTKSDIKEIASLRRKAEEIILVAGVIRKETEKELIDHFRTAKDLIIDLLPKSIQAILNSYSEKKYNDEAAQLQWKQDVIDSLLTKATSGCPLCRAEGQNHMEHLHQCAVLQIVHEMATDSWAFKKERKELRELEEKERGNSPRLIMGFTQQQLKEKAGW